MVGYKSFPLIRVVCLDRMFRRRRRGAGAAGLLLLLVVLLVAT